MKRPIRVKFFGQKYKISYDHKNEESLGETDIDTNTITIRGSLQEEKIIRVLMHEITHAVIGESPMTGRKRFNEEEVCDIVGYLVIPALKENPHLTEYVFSDTGELKDDTEQEPQEAREGSGTNLFIVIVPDVKIADDDSRDDTNET